MSVLENLRRLNRKERYWLLATALSDGDDMRLARGFRQRLQEALNKGRRPERTEVRIPQDAYVAMDFHLDWLVVALSGANFESREPVPDNQNLLAGHQEDLDLLIAWQTGAQEHVLLLEAKGDGAWGQTQFDSKASRLGRIAGSKLVLEGNVELHFVLASPRPPGKLKYSSAPEWMLDSSDRPVWIPLALGPSLLRLERCDSGGLATPKGGHWHLLKATGADVSD